MRDDNKVRESLRGLGGEQFENITLERGDRDDWALILVTAGLHMVTFKASTGRGVSVMHEDADGRILARSRNSVNEEDEFLDWIFRNCTVMFKAPDGTDVTSLPGTDVTSLPANSRWRLMKQLVMSYGPEIGDPSDAVLSRLDWLFAFCKLIYRPSSKDEPIVHSVVGYGRDNSREELERVYDNYASERGD